MGALALLPVDRQGELQASKVDDVAALDDGRTIGQDPSRPLPLNHCSCCRCRSRPVMSFTMVKPKT